MKSLFNYALDVINARASFYDDSLDLKVLEAQGYSKTSAPYKQKKLKAQSDFRTIMEKSLVFARETQIFAKKCGFEFERDSDSDKALQKLYENSINFLPSQVPAEKENEVNIFNFPKEKYTVIEEAERAKKIGELKREANYKMTLKATGEYKLNSTQSHYDDLGAKLTWNWNGISAGGGMYFPLGTNLFDLSSSAANAQKNDSPYFQFSLGFNLSDWRLAKITEKQEILDAKLEDNALLSAEDSYETDILSKVSTFHDIKWNQKSYKDEYETYVQLADDMEKWYKQGIVTENDWLDAVNNREKARINILINDINLLIYNDETKLLFHED